MFSGFSSVTEIGGLAFHCCGNLQEINMTGNLTEIGESAFSCDKLKIKLHVEKIDFEEKRQMQIAFFKTKKARPSPNVIKLRKNLSF